jgi:hypothetical protein
MNAEQVIRVVPCPWCARRLDVAFLSADDGRVFGSTPVHACENAPTVATVGSGLTPLPPPPSVQAEAAA